MNQYSTSFAFDKIKPKIKNCLWSKNKSESLVKSKNSKNTQLFCNELLLSHEKVSGGWRCKMKYETLVNGEIPDLSHFDYKIGEKKLKIKMTQKGKIINEAWVKVESKKMKYETLVNDQTPYPMPFTT